MVTSCDLKQAKTGRIKVEGMQTWAGKTWSSPFFRYTATMISYNVMNANRIYTELDVK